METFYDDGASINLPVEVVMKVLTTGKLSARDIGRYIRTNSDARAIFDVPENVRLVCDTLKRDFSLFSDENLLTDHMLSLWSQDLPFIFFRVIDGYIQAYDVLPWQVHTFSMFEMNTENKEIYPGKYGDSYVSKDRKETFELPLKVTKKLDERGIALMYARLIVEMHKETDLYIDMFYTPTEQANWVWEAFTHKNPEWVNVPMVNVGKNTYVIDTNSVQMIDETYRQHPLCTRGFEKDEASEQGRNKRRRL